MSGRLDGKVAIVTGAGSGLGAASAIRFASEGASVLCADINLEGAEQTVKEIRASGGSGLAHEVDVTDVGATESMAAAATAEWGTIDVLYANAGIVAPGSTATTCTPETWARVLAVNLTGPWLCSRAVLPTMIAAERGSIILQASGAGILGVRGSCPYAASKGGVIAMCRQMASDYGPNNIRVNAIAPGTIWTPLVQRNYEDRVAEGRYASVEEGMRLSTGRYPLGRLGAPADNASLALFLASDESHWITGVTIPVDGGLTSSSGLIPAPEKSVAPS
jgi:NAD(P)-dependent dehydrogenase (short-subunit alcohol dehydrogenase family)